MRLPLPIILLLLLAPMMASGQTGAGKRNSVGKSKTTTASKPKFAWPVSTRKIVSRYGERTNPKTGTVTVNPGVNIGAKKGAVVSASRKGTVSLVSFMPGYGTIVIVQHADGYKTVYANLAAAAVKQGDALDAGEKLGTVGSTSEGTFLHFEVWKGDRRLNPMTVLK